MFLRQVNPIIHIEDSLDLIEQWKVEYMEKIESVTVIDDRGRITIPYRIRERLGIETGETAIRIVYEAGELKITLA